MNCPFCGGRVQRVVQSERPGTWRARVGQALVADVLFWFAAALFLSLAFWNLAVAVLGFVLAAVAMFKWHPHRFAYRCTACQTVLTYREVKRGPRNAL
jgi:hypothetical protein